jgi:hypothetical protein
MVFFLPSNRFTKSTHNLSTTLDNQQGLSFKGGWYPMSQKKQFPISNSPSPDIHQKPVALLDAEQLAELIRTEIKQALGERDIYHKIKHHLIEILLLLVFLIEAGRYLWSLLFKH